MQNISFYKYQGTGNDFVMIDNRELQFPKKQTTIARLCHRRFGIGADGLILIENASGYDFRMVYYNANGLEGSMCGNGGRCSVAFAKFLHIFDQKTTFLATDGEHQAHIDAQNLVHLKMINVNAIQQQKNNFFLDTGSPHYVEFVENLENFDVVGNGKAIRYSERFREVGTNVNFVEIISKDRLRVRTYERGVEDETYSCGTGVTASVLVYSIQNKTNLVEVQTLGGALRVSYEYKEEMYQNIFLIAEAKQVFVGQMYL